MNDVCSTRALPDPELLTAFVADHRSFTRAATALNRAQSAVSMQIKRLEERLGTELFHRTKVNVDLSLAGEGLLGYARRILLLNDEAVGHLQQHKVEGRVRLGVMDDYGSFVVPPVLASFVAAYPRIHIEMETGLTARMPERLGEDFDPRDRNASRRPGRRRAAATRTGGLGHGRFAIGGIAGPAAGCAVSAGLPVPPMGDRGARCVGTAMATGLREPQPRGRGVHCGAGTGGDGGEAGHLSAEAASAVGARWHAAASWGGYTAASGGGSAEGGWVVGGSHRAGHCALTGTVSWQPL